MASSPDDEEALFKPGFSASHAAMCGHDGCAVLQAPAVPKLGQKWCPAVLQLTAQQQSPA